MSLRVLSVVSEIFPLVKTGGLADVAGALPLALAAEGVAVRSLVPGYSDLLAGVEQAESVELGEMFGGTARLLAARAHGLDLLVLDAPHLYARPGNIYMQPDNAFRFGALGLAAARIAHGALGAWRPDIVHAHDWQAGLAPAYLHYQGGPLPGTVMTVHNLAFQGEFPPDLLGALHLPPGAFHIDGVEYYGAIGFLKAGLRLADRVTTVSPSYAAEIRTDAGGMGLGGLLRARAGALSGILNGIDTDVWDPASDRHLVARYDADTLGSRAANKLAVQRRFHLAEEPDRLLFGIVGRLTWQKGGDLLLDALPALGEAQLALLGTGEPRLEAGFADAAAAHPGRVGVVIGYDEALAHLIQGGCDALLVPSRFEPCGLTQLCALRYGTLPVVARTGGLADTVIDANEMALAAGVATGVQFAPVTREMLETALARTAALWRDQPAWRRHAAQRDGLRCELVRPRAPLRRAVSRARAALIPPRGEHLVEPGEVRAAREPGRPRRGEIGVAAGEFQRIRQQARAQADGRAVRIIAHAPFRCVRGEESEARNVERIGEMHHRGVRRDHAARMGHEGAELGDGAHARLQRDPCIGPGRRALGPDRQRRARAQPAQDPVMRGPRHVAQRATRRRGRPGCRASRAREAACAARARCSASRRTEPMRDRRRAARGTSRSSRRRGTRGRRRNRACRSRARWAAPAACRAR